MMADCCSDAFYALASKKNLGNFGKTLSSAMAEMRINNKFN